MPRLNYTTQMVVQFDNPIQPPVFGAPVLLTSIAVVANEQGQPIYQPSNATIPAVPEDITDEMLVALQVKLGALGLEVTRKP